MPQRHTNRTIQLTKRETQTKTRNANATRSKNIRTTKRNQLGLQLQQRTSTHAFRKARNIYNTKQAKRKTRNTQSKSSHDLHQDMVHAGLLVLFRATPCNAASYMSSFNGRKICDTNVYLNYIRLAVLLLGQACPQHTCWVHMQLVETHKTM